MEIVADLFGWGIVGVTVAAPLVSLMTDLRERKDGRGGATHPSPDTKHDLPECGAHAPAPGATGGTVVTDAEAPSPGCCSRRPRRKKGSAEPRALPRVAEESCAPNVGTSSAPRLAIPHAEPVAACCRAPFLNAPSTDGLACFSAHHRDVCFDLS